MLDVKLIRENPSLVRENLKKRNDPQKMRVLEELIKVDGEWRTAQTGMNSLRQKRNQASIEISKLKKAGKSAAKLLTEARKIDKVIEKSERKISELDSKEKSLLMNIPNMLHDSVPVGKDDADNVEIRRWGQQPKFDFEPKDHLTILQNLGLIDVERGAKTAGERFYYLKNELVLLDMALQKFALDTLRKKEFVIMSPPFMIRRKPYEGVIDLTDFEQVTYKIENEDAYLIATSEHPIASMFMDEILDGSKLPLMFAGVSPCFRKEVGAHGKYTKGLFRMHHFNKVEQFIFCRPEDSWKLHEELQKNSELMYQSLGLHYRVVNVCTGDIGSIASKKYDTEFWMSDGHFREMGSNSNCTDYQARRLGMRFREGEGKPVAGFVHTLNNTALATSRVMIAIIEQFQQKDGSVVIPKVLRPYMFNIEKLEKK